MTLEYFKKSWLGVFGIAILVCVGIIIWRIYISPSTIPVSTTHTITADNNNSIVYVKQGETVSIDIPSLPNQDHNLSIDPPGVLAEKTPLSTDSENHIHAVLSAEKKGQANLSITSKAHCSKGKICTNMVLLELKTNIIVE